MKVLIGPLNIASQPYYLARGLRKYGVDATSIVYGTDISGQFGYKNDLYIDISGSPVQKAKIFSETIKSTLEHNYDIYHFFQRSLFPSSPHHIHDKLIGFDIPLLKLRGKKIAYRFTGWEVIDSDTEKSKNKYSALFEKDFDGLFDEHLKREYINFLRCYVDAFMVVDPMMQEHIPEASIVPRVLDVSEFEHVGIQNKKRPLILHAPTNPAYKGTKYILSALETLKSEGLDFDIKLLGNMPFNQAMEWYKKCDILIDQLHVGWHGVLAMELMAMGKPVAVYMRPDLADAPRDIPVWNIDKDNIVNQLRRLITDFSLREDLALRARPYIQKNCDESVVIPKLISVYRGMMERPALSPQGTADIDFLCEQRILIEQMQEELNDLRSRYLETSVFNKLGRIIMRTVSRHALLQKITRKTVSLMPVGAEMTLRKIIRRDQIRQKAKGKN